MKKNNALVVLDALLLGRNINVRGRTYRLCGNYELCVMGSSNADDGSDDFGRLLYTGDSLGQFIKFCDSMTDYEIDVVAANLGLNRINRGEK